MIENKDLPNKKIEFTNGEREVINTTQELYDNFNKFIFSDDSKVFSKLVARTILFDKVKDIPGDIVECGVYKGSGILTWLKLKKSLSPNAFKKVIGFDMFDSSDLIESLSGHDKNTMSDLFENRNFVYSDYDISLSNIISECGFSTSDYELVKGDISKTSVDFVNTRPGFKISLLYLDLDLEKPTYDTLVAFWPRMSKGGIIVLDEYAYHQWSESKGVDKFVEECDVELKILNFNAPTAYIKKK